MILFFILMLFNVPVNSNRSHWDSCLASVQQNCASLVNTTFLSASYLLSTESKTRALYDFVLILMLFNAPVNSNRSYWDSCLASVQQNFVH